MPVLNVQKIKENRLDKKDKKFFYDNLRSDCLYKMIVPNTFQVQLNKPLWLDINGTLFHTEYLRSKSGNKYKGLLGKYKIWISNA